MFLTKSNFGISSKKRYKWDTDWRLINCEYGRKLTTDHALVCKKGGFVTQCHNNIQGIIAEICYDLKVEPQLQLLTSERLRKKHTANTRNQSHKNVLRVIPFAWVLFLEKSDMLFMFWWAFLIFFLFHLLFTMFIFVQGFWCYFT